jgi:peptidyl-tRNA hydrolase
MYIVANKGLNMSPGKLASQVAHAAVRSYVGSDPFQRDLWLASGEMKIVLEARDETHMRNIADYLAEHDIKVCTVIDEGRTEIPPLSITALAAPVLDKDDEKVKFAFETLKLYRETDTNVYKTSKEHRFLPNWGGR